MPPAAYVRSDDDVRRVFGLWHQGVPKKAIARQTGVSHTQVQRWIGQGIDAVLNSPVRVEWRWDGPTQISIARRQSVALLDSFVGPKA